jgi:hypothetical protein
MKNLTRLLILSGLFIAHANAERISLDGDWAFQTDPYKVGLLLDHPIKALESDIIHPSNINLQP